MKKRICQITVTLLTLSMLTIGVSAAQTNCNSAVNSLLTQLLIQQLECRGITLPGAVTNPDPKPPVVKPPDVEPPVVTPPACDTPSCQPTDCKTPDCKPPVVNPPVVDPPVVDPGTSTEDILPYEMQVIKLVNEIRVENGLKALSPNAKLCEVARVKSEDMKKNNYFAHTSPTYGSPFDMLKSFGISYRSAGENIAYGYSSPKAVVDGWMNSPGHRENILKSSFTQIGVGYYANGNYWTQHFIG